MTNELEKQFFDTFKIEPKYYCGSEYIFEAMLENECTDGNLEKCKTCEKVGRTYPQISDSILLKLICIATASEITVEFKGIKNVEHLKEVVLNYCIKRYNYCLHKDKFKQQVQTLFKETK